MDNLKYRIKGVEIDTPTLTSNLNELNIPVSRKSVPKLKDELINFSLPIGKHHCRWMFHCSLKEQSILCSGGVTKTFFGHNAWVFKREIVQIEAIIKIIAADLKSIGGIALPDSMDAITIERTEITRHHALNDSIDKREALERLNAMFMAKFPNRHFYNGATHDRAGTTGIGLNKNSRVCRAYDPFDKFKEKPTHVSEEIWNLLRAECANHLRIELIFDKRELQSAGLSTVAAWANTALIDEQVVKRYEDYGLSSEFKTKVLQPDLVISTNPAFVEAARFFFTGGARGKQINSRSGTSNRFKQYMTAKGYCVDVAFSHHIHLAHGLHRILQPQLAAELPDELRSAPDLFNFWWQE